MDTYTFINKFSSSLDNLYTKTKKKILHPSDRLLTIYLLVFVAICCFGVTWVKNGFTVPLSGDYTLQEMTFLFNGYDDWHTFFRTGSFPTWDRSIFLGIDNIGGNSFYYLFDPFFLLCLPFPRDWLLVLQGLSFVPKMVIAGMFFYWYLGSFGFSNKTRRMGALAFGFSAYSFSYLWFHFIDSVAFLPLVFLGIERILKDRDPRIFLIGFFLNAMTSYFFFVVFMFGAFFYAIFRYFQTIKDRDAMQNWDTIGMGVLSFVLAIMLGCFTLLPGISTANGMPRVSSASYLSNIFSAETWKDKLNAIFSYGSNQHNQVTPLLNFLFLYDDCYSSNLLNVYWYDNFVAGLYVTTPMLLMFFVSFIDSIKQKKWSHLIGLALTCFLIFTPIGFYLFSGFTVGYARYFIVPISWMVVFDLQAIERRRKIPRSYLDLSFVITMILMALSCFLMIYEVNLQPSHFTSATDWDYKMFLIPGCLLWVTVCYFIIRPFFHKRKFSKVIFILSSIDIIVMANLTINIHGLSSSSQNPDISEESKIVSLLKSDENNNDYYRIYNTSADRGNINLSLREGYQGLGAFHSVYAYQSQNFLDRSRIPYTYHNWSMGIHNRRYNLETFLGTKYYLVDRIDKSYDGYATPLAYPNRIENGNWVWAKDYDIPYGYVDVTTLTSEQMKSLGVEYSSDLIDFLKSDNCTKSLYVNTNFVDFAFAYDQVINESWLATNLSYKKDSDSLYYNLYEDENEYPLLRAAIVPDEDFQSFYNQGKYNAGKYTMNGVTYDIVTGRSKLSDQARYFQTSQVTSGKYKKDSSAPMEVYQIGTGSNRLKVTIYSAQWPNTEANSTGEYASCDASNPYDTNCLTAYAKEHPWEYQNGIRPADLKYDYETLTDDNGEKKDEYTRSVLYNSKIVIIPTDRNGNPTTIMPEADPNDPSTGGYISIFDNQNIEWRLYDENDHIISYAKHSYSEYKQAHGYYVDRPVAKILGIVQTGTKSEPVKLTRPIIYVQRNSDYQQAIDNLRKEKAEITYRVDDQVNFKINYSSNKFVVLNYPYSNGWNLYEVTNGVKTKVKTYNAQGGFIGFEGEIGEHEYQLVYSSPNFKIGMMITAIGLFISYLIFSYFALRNKYRYYRFMDNVLFEKKKNDSIRKVEHDYVNYEDEL